MSWLSKLFGKTQIDRRIELARARGFTHDIVGEASYQSNIEKIVGGKKQHSAKHECMAVLACEVGNPHDVNAVVVMIDSKVVGYLSRHDAENYRLELEAIDMSLPKANVYAKVIGGWKNEDEGHFGVKLNLKRPLQKAEVK